MGRESRENGWTYWFLGGKVIAHLGPRRFRLRRFPVPQGHPRDVVLTLHPAAPPPLPEVGRWILVDALRGATVVICLSWEPISDRGVASARAKGWIDD